MEISCPAFSFDFAESIFAVSSEIRDCVSATCFWLSRIWELKSDITPPDVNLIYTML